MSKMEITDTGEVVARLGELEIHAWLQTEDGLRWEYAGLAANGEPGEGEFDFRGVRYRSLYGNTRHFWVGLCRGSVKGIHRNERYDGMSYQEFRQKLGEFMGQDGAQELELVLLPREEAFSLPTQIGA